MRNEELPNALFPAEICDEHIDLIKALGDVDALRAMRNAKTASDAMLRLAQMRDRRVVVLQEHLAVGNV